MLRATYHEEIAFLLNVSMLIAICLWAGFAYCFVDVGKHARMTVLTFYAAGAFVFSLHYLYYRQWADVSHCSEELTWGELQTENCTYVHMTLEGCHNSYWLEEYNVSVTRHLSPLGPGENPLTTDRVTVRPYKGPRFAIRPNATPVLDPCTALELLVGTIMCWWWVVSPCLVSLIWSVCAQGRYMLSGSGECTKGDEVIVKEEREGCRELPVLGRI